MGVIVLVGRAPDAIDGLARAAAAGRKVLQAVGRACNKRRQPALQGDPGRGRRRRWRRRCRRRRCRRRRCGWCWCGRRRGGWRWCGRRRCGRLRRRRCRCRRRGLRRGRRRGRRGRRGRRQWWWRWWRVVAAATTGSQARAAESQHKRPACKALEKWRQGHTVLPGVEYGSILDRRTHAALCSINRAPSVKLNFSIVVELTTIAAESVIMCDFQCPNYANEHTFCIYFLETFLSGHIL